MTIRTKLILLAAATGLLLAACGGGGGTTAMLPEQRPPPVQELDPDENGPPVAPDEDAGMPDPDPEPVEPETPSAALQRLVGSSNTVTKGNTISADIWSTTIQRTPADLMLSDLIRNSGADLLALESRQGVSLASSRAGSAFDWGGWMEHNFFVLSVWNPIDDDPLDPSESVFADVYSVGEATGANPVSGDATWQGAVVGVDASETANEGNVILGDAMIVIDDFANPAVDIRFTNLVDQTTNGARADMSWQNLPMVNGAFAHNGDLRVGVSLGDRGNQLDSLSGRFYGPNHEEVGGVFLRNQISGAFGAKRQ